MLTGASIDFCLVARLPQGGWSAPVAVGSFGLGWGLQLGAALADVVIVFMKPSALHALTHGDGTELSLGPESGIAVGPMGRVAGMSHALSGLDDASPGPTAVDVAGALPSLDEVRQGGLSDANLAKGRAVSDKLLARAALSAAAAKPAYTYSHCKGLFVGVSLEGSALTVRDDVNKNFYGRRVSPAAVLAGGVKRPLQLRAAGELYAMLAALATDDPLPPEAAPHAPSAWVPPRNQWDAPRSGGASGGGDSGWVPPRDKWERPGGGLPPARSPQPSAQAPLCAVSNPFTEPGDIPSGSLGNPLSQYPQARGRTQPPAPTDSFSINGDESDGEEFSI